jgi:hypothetical protein
MPEVGVGRDKFEILEEKFSRKSRLRVGYNDNTRTHAKAHTHTQIVNLYPAT